MKKLLPILMAAILLIAGCASKPETPAPEPVPEPVVEPAPSITQAQLDELLSEASALRKRAFDLKLFEVVAEDYKAADARFVTGKTAYDANDTEAAEPALRDAIEGFKDVIAKGVKILAAENRQKAEDMKALAIKTGAEDKAAERLAEGDALFDSAGDLTNSGKDEDAIVVYESARKTYEAAYKRANAQNLKGIIEGSDFARSDPGNMELADRKFEESDTLFASDPDASLDALDEATLRYNLVIQKGWQNYAVERKAPADDAKEKSEAIKAQVAVKDHYTEALTVYNNASALMAGGNYEEAGQEFERAAELFEAVYAEAQVKRDAALSALEALDAKAQESGSKAKAGDDIIGSGTE